MLGEHSEALAYEDGYMVIGKTGKALRHYE